MSWCCPECGSSNPDSSIRCEACGKSLRQSISLVGPLKTLSWQAPAVIGRTVYKRLVGDESRFVDHEMYDLAFDEANGCWTLTPRPRTCQVVVVNGSPLAEGVPVQVLSGDRVEIGSRKSEARVAALEIHIA